MKLSEAIMLNGMTKPQGRGADSITSIDEPCAIGGALQAIGKQLCSTEGLNENYVIMAIEWPWILEQDVCPQCGEFSTQRDIIWQLNDKHEWTRQQIAHWVATVEPTDVPEPEITELILVEAK